MTANPPTHAELEELLGAYVLDAVDADERAAVEAHLADCPRCRAEVDAGHEVAAALAQSGTRPPDGLWERIAGEIEGDAPPPLRLVPAGGPTGATVPHESPRRPMFRRAVLGVGAAAAAVVIVALATQAIDDDERTDVAAAAASAFEDDASLLGSLHDDGGTVLATVAVLPDGNGFLRVEDLPTIEHGVYQLWGATPDHVVSLGVFDDDDEIVTFHAGAGTDTIMVTHEDAPVERSDRPPVVLGELA